VPVIPAAAELFGETPFEEVDRPSAGSTLVPTEDMRKLMQVGDDRKFSPQGDDICNLVVGTVVTATAVDLPEPEPCMLAVNATEVFVQAVELRLPFHKRPSPGVALLEAKDSLDGRLSEADPIVEDL
jgi:hypothetical protein